MPKDMTIILGVGKGGKRTPPPRFESDTEEPPVEVPAKTPSSPAICGECPHCGAPIYVGEPMSSEPTDVE